MKKTLSVVLSLVLIFSVINLGGITAFAENETIVDGDIRTDSLTTAPMSF